MSFLHWGSHRKRWSYAPKSQETDIYFCEIFEKFICQQRKLLDMKAWQKLLCSHIENSNGIEKKNVRKWRRRNAHAQNKINELLAAFEQIARAGKKKRKRKWEGKAKKKNPNQNVMTATTTFELRLAETGNSIYDNRTEGIFHIQLS